ncbi:hypothetical protein [Prochlorococcus sp. MIT 1300]|uniref:hypothetical protein n=1 Tax=Prochlorococcus sp. MIT 1300 TaxID=3096218 RepID=UPI002A75D7EA|nr:hypothetical protein [Prochlorococcus sp. MIT 1300]
MTATHTQDFRLQRRLQQDSIQLSGKTVYINPFLYWRRFDTNTDRWLREPGQLGEDQITLNRSRFYPELEWSLLDDSQRNLKDAAVEMFLKSLELIGTFHPDLTAGQLLEVERKMTVTKKEAFERWVGKSLRRRLNEESREKQRFERERVFRMWREWFCLEASHQAMGVFLATVILSGFVGWSIGLSKTTSTTFLVPSEQTGIR